MTKPNPTRSIYNLLYAQWTLTGDLARTSLVWLVDQKQSATTNNPTVYIQKGRTISHTEGVPKGVTGWVDQEIYVTPFFAPAASGTSDQLWSIREEVRRIIRAYPTSASGIQNMWLNEKSPRSSSSQDPYRGNEVVVTTFWRE